MDSFRPPYEHDDFVEDDKFLEDDETNKGLERYYTALEEERKSPEETIISDKKNPYQS